MVAFSKYHVGKHVDERFHTVVLKFKFECVLEEREM